MKRKNPKEDYLDKSTQWQLISQINFSYLLEQVIDFINSNFRTVHDLRLRFFSNLDNSYTIQEYKKGFYGDKIISSIIIAPKLHLGEDENIFVIYSKLPKSKNWNQEIILIFEPHDSQLISATRNSLMRFLMESFPKFYMPIYFNEFEEIQRTERDNYEMFLQLRKKNPKVKIKL